MAGELVPLVMLPRYTTLAGNENFRTIGMDVTEYQNAILSVWRGQMVGGATDPQIYFEESTDQDSWTDCTGFSGGRTLTTAGAEVQYSVPLNKRWFRIRMALDTGSVATFWAVGFLEDRQA